MTARVEGPGDRVKKLREAGGLSQMALCRLSGVSQATLYRAEVGGVVTRATAERLSLALHCSPKCLLGEPQP